MNKSSRLPEILSRHEGEILADWVQQQLTGGAVRGDMIRESELREQSRAFLGALREGLDSGNVSDTNGAAWRPARDFITELARNRARPGFTPVETATFLLSLKFPLFDRLRREYATDAPAVAAEIWTATELLDQLGR